MIISILFGPLLSVAAQVFAQHLASPDGYLALLFRLDNGIPTYQLAYKNKTVIATSRLGLEMEEASLTGGFLQKDVRNSSFDETWTPVWGEYASIRNQYNELLVTLTQENEYKRVLLIRFLLFNDGLGSRYELPEQETIYYLIVKDEYTEFNLTGNLKTFCIPGDYDTNEFAYTTAPLSEIKEVMEKRLCKKGYESKATSFTVQTPLMMKC